jgi:hypothetical protein
VYDARRHDEGKRTQTTRTHYFTLRPAPPRDLLLPLLNGESASMLSDVVDAPPRELLGDTQQQRRPRLQDIARLVTSHVRQHRLVWIAGALHILGLCFVLALFGSSYDVPFPSYADGNRGATTTTPRHSYYYHNYNYYYSFSHYFTARRDVGLVVSVNYLSMAACMCYVGVAAIDLTCSFVCQERKKNCSNHCHTCRCFSNNLLRALLASLLIIIIVQYLVLLASVGMSAGQGICEGASSTCSTSMCCCVQPTLQSPTQCSSPTLCSSVLGACVAPFSYASVTATIVVLAGLTLAMHLGAWAAMARHSVALSLNVK